MGSRRDLKIKSGDFGFLVYLVYLGGLDFFEAGWEATKGNAAGEPH